MSATVRDVISPDLRTTLRALKLGRMLPTLPDRLTLARQQKMAHAGFLEPVLADEHARREAKYASLRACAAGLNTGMRLDTWDETAAVISACIHTGQKRDAGQARLLRAPRILMFTQP
ncbi:MAG TPA: hypothetical protein VMV17_23930 [Streptosporangiaceae bacterium]|nr:hypothetical protein [Streptosporangiaceae bacterium]